MLKSIYKYCKSMLSLVYYNYRYYKMLTNTKNILQIYLVILKIKLKITRGET